MSEYMTAHALGILNIGSWLSQWTLNSWSIIVQETVLNGRKTKTQFVYLLHGEIGRFKVWTNGKKNPGLATEKRSRKLRTGIKDDF